MCWNSLGSYSDSRLPPLMLHPKRSGSIQQQNHRRAQAAAQASSQYSDSFGAVDGSTSSNSFRNSQPGYGRTAAPSNYRIDHGEFEGRAPTVRYDMEDRACNIPKKARLGQEQAVADESYFPQQRTSCTQGVEPRQTDLRKPNQGLNSQTATRQTFHGYNSSLPLLPPDDASDDEEYVKPVDFSRDSQARSQQRFMMSANGQSTSMHGPRSRPGMVTNAFRNPSSVRSKQSDLYHCGFYNPACDDTHSEEKRTISERLFTQETKPASERLLEQQAQLRLGTQHSRPAATGFRGPAETPSSVVARQTQKVKQQKNPEDRGLQIVTCTVESMQLWAVYQGRLNLLFEVFGKLHKPVTFNGDTMQEFTIKGARGSVACIFYTMDRFLCEMPVGTAVRCIGKLSSDNRLQCLSLRAATAEEQKQGLQLVKLCNKLMQEVVADIREI